MTEKEAISILRKWRNIGKKDMTSERLGYIEGWFHKDDSEAFAMAIKALKVKHPCDLCRWKGIGQDEYCWDCNAQHRVEEGAEE